MSLIHIFDIAGSGMKAQSVRLNTVASNLSNATNVAGSKEKTYRAKMPVFQTGQSTDLDPFNQILSQANTGVRVTEITENQTPARQEYRPGHPMADKEGYIYTSNVNSVEEMANMISASRSYDLNVHVADVAKQMVMQVLKLGE